MWTTRIDTPAAIDKFEKKLIKKGFVRVSDDTSTDDLRLNEYRRRLAVPERGQDISLYHALLWRSEK